MVLADSCTTMASFAATSETQEPQSSNNSRSLPLETQQSEETPWDKLPFAIRQNIMQRFKDPTEKKSAIKSLRQAGPMMRRFANETITSLDLSGSAEIGGTLRDLSKFPEVSILKCDFSKNIGEVSELATFLERNSKPIVLELKNLDAVDTSNPTVRSPDRSIDVRSSKANATGSNFVCSSPTSSQCFNDKPLDTKRPCLRFLSESPYVRVLILSGSDKTIRDNVVYVCNVPNMKTLKLDIKEAGGEVIWHLLHLQAELHLRMHGIDSEQSLAWVKFLPTLTSFDVQLCGISNLPFALKRLRSLTNLSITTDTICVEDAVSLLGVRDQLRTLQLTLTDTNGLALDALCKCKLPLTDLSVTMPFFETDGSLGFCTQLKTLRIFAAREFFSGVSLVCLESLKQLEELSVVKCSNWEPVLSVLSPSLTSLTMCQTHITGPVFEGISHLPFLRDLALHWCRFLNTLNPVKEMRNLKRMTISKCFQIEEALDTVLVSSLPEGLRELNLGFFDESGLEAHQSLLTSLKKSYPYLDVKLARAESVFFEF